MDFEHSVHFFDVVGVLDRRTGLLLCISYSCAADILYLAYRRTSDVNRGSKAPAG